MAAADFPLGTRTAIVWSEAVYIMYELAIRQANALAISSDQASE